MTASRLRSKAVAISAALVVLAAAVGIGWWYLRPDEDTITVTAQFDSASGLYEGNVVAVLGMPVGKIIKINAKGGYVEVEFTVDRHVKVPADRASRYGVDLDPHRPADRAHAALPRRSGPGKPRHHRLDPDQDARRIQPRAQCARSR